MQTITPCNPYHAVLSRRELCRGADGKSFFKVYFIDIVGRKEPSRTEWSKSGINRADFLARLAKAEGVVGIGFIVAFPHVTRVFRFGPEAETVLNVRGWNTRDLTPLNICRSEGYIEFACLAEALVAADEYNAWATAGTVQEYLGTWSAFAEGPVARHDKLSAYWRQS